MYKFTHLRQLHTVMAKLWFLPTEKGYVQVYTGPKAKVLIKPLNLPLYNDMVGVQQARSQHYPESLAKICDPTKIEKFPPQV